MILSTKSLRMSVLLCMITILCASCRVGGNFKSAEEQCKILFEKRTQGYASHKKARTVRVKTGYKYPGHDGGTLLVQNKKDNLPPGNKDGFSPNEPDKDTRPARALAVTHSETTLKASGAKLNLKPANLKAKVSDPHVDHSTRQVYAVRSGSEIPVSGNVLSFAGVLSAFVTFTILGLARNRARKISQWAAANPWKSRGLIAALQTISTIGALMIGHHLYNAGVNFETTIGLGWISVFLASAITYPNAFPRIIPSGKPSYLKRKMYDMAVYTSATMLMLQLGNTAKFDEVYASARTQISPNYAHQVMPVPTFGEERVQPETNSRSEGGKGLGAKIALTIAAVLVFLTIGYLVAALACSLSCSGAEAAAVLVAIFGFGGLIVGLIKVIQRIFRKEVPLLSVRTEADIAMISQLLKPSKVYRIEMKSGEIIRLNYVKSENGNLFGRVGNRDHMYSIDMNLIRNIWRR